MTDGPEIMTIKEAAAYFRVSKRTFQSFIAKHPHYKMIGRRKIFDMADIENLKRAMQAPVSSAYANIITAPSERALNARLRKILAPKSGRNSA